MRNRQKLLWLMGKAGVTEGQKWAGCWLETGILPPSFFSRHLTVLLLHSMHREGGGRARCAAACWGGLLVPLQGALTPRAVRLLITFAGCATRDCRVHPWTCRCSSDGRGAREEAGEEGGEGMNRAGVWLGALAPAQIPV